jgi:hypothetical protein
VDGATRCLAIYRNPTLLFHPNNHLLFLVNVLVWTRLAATLGFRPSDPLSFVLTVDMMNVTAGAGCMAVLFWVLLRVTSSWKLASVVCLGYGLTGAFLAQATNPNEPMVGALWSFLGVAFAMMAAGRRNYWPIVVSGLMFALAMATYRTMVFFGPVAAAILVLPVDETKPSRGQQLLRLAILGSAFAVGCVAIFGWAYSQMGVDPSDMLARFLRQEDARIYFDASPLQLLKLPLGLVRNCFPVVPDYNGMRGFLRGPKSVFFSVTALIVVLGLALLFCGYTLVKRRALLARLERTAVLASLAGLLFTMIPLLTWNPHYGKFWIQPLACLAVIVAVALAHMTSMSKHLATAALVAGVLFVAGTTLNLTWAWRNRSHDAFEFEEAHKVTQFVGDKDFLVLERGADSVSGIYGFLWTDESHILPLMDVATGEGKGLLTRLDGEIKKTRAAGGRVFFLGVLDIPKSTWDVFLGDRAGVPYQSFDGYRRNARLRAEFRGRTGLVPLWELMPSSSQATGEEIASPQSHP